MEQPLAQQGLQFLASVLLGLGYGLHYDFLRGLRRSLTVLQHILDFWYGLTILLANLVFALLVGDGAYRIFMLVGTGLGMVFYFLTLSRLFSRLFVFLWQYVTLPLRYLGNKIGFSIKKNRKNIKKLFSRRKKSVKIKRGISGTNNAPKEANDEAQIVTHYKAHHSNA